MTRARDGGGGRQLTRWCIWLTPSWSCSFNPSTAHPCAHPSAIFLSHTCTHVSQVVATEVEEAGKHWPMYSEGIKDFLWKVRGRGEGGRGRGLLGWGQQAGVV